VLAGWVTTEVGRQPWTVYGLLRTAHSVSPSLTGRDVLISLICYMLVYLIIFPVGILLMARIIRKGPSNTSNDAPIEGGQPSGPVVTPPEYTNHAN
jgi:cytochrome d ubiquinol oxidase subunit I